MIPLQANAITKAVQKMLKADPRLENITTIERSPLLNEDPSKCPWIGIYRDESTFEVRTLGLGPGARRQQTRIVLVLQVSNANDGEQTEDELEEYVSYALDVLFSDATLLGNVSTITLSSAKYRLVQVQEDDFFQQAELYITAETVTR